MPSIQIKRTVTPNKAPTGLLPGQLAVEMAAPMRLWVGVPTALDPTGKKLLVQAGAPAGDFVAKTGDTMTGDLIIDKTNPALLLDRTSAAETSSIYSNINGVPLWQLVIGDATVNKAFTLFRYAPDGLSVLNTPLHISHTTGDISTNGGFSVYRTNPWISINKVSGGTGEANDLIGTVQGIHRWRIQLGDPTAENTLNSGSDFAIHAHNDAGAGIFTPLKITRSTGTVTINNALYIFNANNRWASDGNLVISVQGYKPGGGDWADLSDARIKTVHGDYTQGLDAIRQLRPVRYQFNGNVAAVGLASDDPSLRSMEPLTPAHQNVLDKEFVGLVAQEAELSMPEMVTQTTGLVDGVPVNDLRMLDPSALTYALVNACKELAQRVEALETALAARR